jgi:hypothetical protein
MTLPDCKANYKSKKEPTKVPKSKKEEPKPYTKYDRAIGPIKPVKPVAVPKPQEEKPQSYYKDMIAMAMKDYVEPKIPKIPKPNKKTI